MSANTFRNKMSGWDQRTLSNGHELTLHEHNAIILIGDFIAKSVEVAAMPEELSDILRKHQSDWKNGVAQIASFFGTSSIEIELYRWAFHLYIATDSGDWLVVSCLTRAISQQQPACIAQC